MQTPVNPFKQALREGRVQIGLWVGLADAYAAEAMAGTGFDWLLIDGEHAPNDLRRCWASCRRWRLPHACHRAAGDRRRGADQAVARCRRADAAGPHGRTAEQAATLVAAMRYPPRGIRGVGSALARSSRWNQIPDYLHTADAQMCLLLQVEPRSRAGTTWTPSRPPRAWTASSSARPTCRRRWA
jgi:4-hydroxy-2-oxoheptanedioate aldolase